MSAIANAPLPFFAALGDRMNDLHPAVRVHFAQADGQHTYRGIMACVWCGRGWRGWFAKPFCWIGRRANTVFSSAGVNIPFELQTSIDASSTPPTMTWLRTFHFPTGEQTFRGVITHDPHRKVLIDHIGATGRIEVELIPTIDAGAMLLHSRRQWWHILGLQIPLPRWLVGHASIREHQTPDGDLHISLSVLHPFLGEIYGYDGTLKRIS